MRRTRHLIAWFVKCNCNGLSGSYLRTRTISSFCWVTFMRRRSLKIKTGRRMRIRRSTLSSCIPTRIKFWFRSRDMTTWQILEHILPLFYSIKSYNVLRISSLMSLITSWGRWYHQVLLLVATPSLATPHSRSTAPTFQMSSWLFSNSSQLRVKTSQPPTMSLSTWLWTGVKILGCRHYLLTISLNSTTTCLNLTTCSKNTSRIREAMSGKQTCSHSKSTPASRCGRCMNWSMRCVRKASYRCVITLM